MRISNLIAFIFLITLYAILTGTALASNVRQHEASEKKEMIKAKSADETKIIWHRRYRHIDKKTGLRTAYYRAALPPSVPGGKRINVQQAFKHYQNKDAIFLDVMAHTGTGPDPIDGHWRLSEPRENIPGSIWLADVGTGTLTDEMKAYLVTNLERITGGDKSKPLIIYCTADCWMAWNAVRRASRLGYNNLLWFPEGSDEWRAAGHPLMKAIPVPIEITD